MSGYRNAGEGRVGLLRLGSTAGFGRVEATSAGPWLAITRLVIVHTLFVPPLDANGAVVLLNVSFTAHPRPDRYRGDDGSDARPDHPRHASIVADHGVGRNNSYTRRAVTLRGLAAGGAVRRVARSRPGADRATCPEPTGSPAGARRRPAKRGGTPRMAARRSRARAETSVQTAWHGARQAQEPEPRADGMTRRGSSSRTSRPPCWRSPNFRAGGRCGARLESLP
jgi:hypothetical protein